MASGRKSKNLISSLVNDVGEEVKEPKEIEGEILSFFSNLYEPSVANRPFVEGLDWCLILELDRRDLESPFSTEEIKRAIFYCDRNKSPIPDSFSMGFFLG